MEKNKENSVSENKIIMGQSSKNAVSNRKMSPHPTVRRTASDLSNIKIVTKRKDGEKKPFPWATVFVAACFTVLFLFMMMNYISLDNLSDVVNEQNKVINNLTDERDKLEEKLAKKDNLDEVAKYAENELGMVKKGEANDEYYIDINTDDEVNINEYKKEAENGIGVILSGVGNVVKEFFGG